MDTTQEGTESKLSPGERLKALDKRFNSDKGALKEQLREIVGRMKEVGSDDSERSEKLGNLANEGGEAYKSLLDQMAEWLSKETGIEGMISGSGDDEIEGLFQEIVELNG